MTIDRPQSLADLTATIREINIAKGWRPADGGPGSNTWGDYVALLHSEASEALEAYWDHRLAEVRSCWPDSVPLATHYRHSPNCMKMPKPEGVGSELADVVIRLLDMADMFGFKPYEMDVELADVVPLTDYAVRRDTFGDSITWLHRRIATFGANQTGDLFYTRAAYVLRAVVTIAENYGIDITREVNRKIEYNRTRAFQHGGRTLADTPRGTGQ